MIKILDPAHNKSKLKKIIRNAVLLRIVILIIIACSGSWEKSLINQELGVTDDYKYENGAILYMQNAKRVFDPEVFTWAFNTVDPSDWTGTHLDKPISYSVLWYLISCALVMITKTKYAIRLFNILLVGVSIKYLYNFANKIWGQDVASKASKLYAYLPYPIVFSCFGYKEELVLFCTFYWLSHAVDIRKGEKVRSSQIIKLILVALIFLSIRSGISLIFFAFCIIIMFFPSLYEIKHFGMKKLIPFIGLAIVGVYAFIRLGGAVSSKANAYLGVEATGSNAISVLMIHGLKDIWKIPFSYMFSIIMPISLFKPFDSWLALISTLNICMIPISVGCIIYMVIGKKQDLVVYWSTIGYYFIYVITSLVIFRQYAALLPLNLIYYSALTVKAKSGVKILLYVGSTLMAIALIVFYL